VKDRVDLEFPFDQELTDLIDEYVHHFRPSLLRGSNELWLFPGETGGCKDAKARLGRHLQWPATAIDRGALRRTIRGVKSPPSTWV
jgi:hypothetical protein